MSTDLTSPSADPAALHEPLAAAILRAERRRAMLEELAALGMALARELEGRADRAPEARFADVAQAIRRTLAQEAKAEDYILALRNREFEAPAAGGPVRNAGVGASADGDDAQPLAQSPSPSPRRARIGAEVRAAAARALEDPSARAEVLDRLDERLFRSAVYDPLLSRPLREAVESVCADLGLAPDWSAWSDETGFAHDPAGTTLQSGHGQALRQAAENDLIRRLSLSPARGAPGHGA